MTTCITASAPALGPRPNTRGSKQMHAMCDWPVDDPSANGPTATACSPFQRESHRRRTAGLYNALCGFPVGPVFLNAAC